MGYAIPPLRCSPAAREYGIKEVSMGQYEAVCKKIVHFSSEHGFSAYHPVLKTDYDAFIDAKVNDKSICYEYGRFQHRVIRMMVSLAETDFSGCFNPPGKYTVSRQSAISYGCIPGEEPPDVEGLIRKHTLSVRPSKNFARQQRFQVPVSFTYRF